MKKILFILAFGAAASLTACTKSDFKEAYTDPSTLSDATIDKLFSGMLYTNREYVLPSYWNYFVVLRTTLTHYTQAVGFVNGGNQYIPGAAAIGDRWNNYYQFLAQYKEIERVYNAMSEEMKADYKIYKIAAAITFYDHTQKVVDLHGDIPWTEAGMLSTNNGDYSASYAKYDQASAIYVKMLDDLKTYADELNTIDVKSGIMEGFKSQDIINSGSLTAWKKYCNSLRLRMLTRVSGDASLKGRADAERAAILNDPATYPVVETNAENIQINVYNLSTPINSSGFQSGLEDWDGNLAGKAMIDLMNTTADPRLRAMFEPGDSAHGAYIGLDPLAKQSDQTALVAGGTIARYNRSSISRNKYFPGVLINAAEVSFLKAEYYVNSGDDAKAKAAYETGIKQSVEYYYNFRTLSSDNTSGALTPTNATEINAYLASPEVSWSAATTTAEKIALIATQKWIHYSVIQLPESWAEIRRLNSPVFNFEVDASNAQSLPPNRWVYPSSETGLNAANYEAVKANDKLTTKIFWDVN